MIAQKFIDNRFPKNKVLTLCSIARSSYYYRPSEGKRGRKPYAKAVDKSGQVIGNEIIVEYIHQLFDHPFVDYGYIKPTFTFIEKSN